MASLFEFHRSEVHLLDAGAGAGALSAALVERFIAGHLSWHLRAHRAGGKAGGVFWLQCDGRACRHVARPTGFWFGQQFHRQPAHRIAFAARFFRRGRRGDFDVSFGQRAAQAGMNE